MRAPTNPQSLNHATILRHQRRNLTGKKAEDLACQSYLSVGAQLLVRNYRLRCGEVDLIFEEPAAEGPQFSLKSPTLVFVEVRARSPQCSWESPEESLSASKLRRIRLTAGHFLSHYRGPAQSIRFDLASWDLKMIRIFKNFWWY
ncbi:MAG: YraN family protein [Bdellovibrionales bacterium]|nr:YraN family protein [Bdellovibrionales bacterium]